MLSEEETIAKIDKIVTKLKATNTVAYKTWLNNMNAGKYTDPGGTNWQQAFNELRALRDDAAAKIKPTPTPTPTPTGAKGLGTISYMSSPNITDPQAYDDIVTTFGAPLIAEPKHHHHYVSCVSMNSEWWSGVWPTGPGEQYKLKDAAGNYLINRGYPENFIGDPGSVGYQDEWVKQVLEHCAAKGVTKLFCDDCTATPLGLMSAYPALYPTPEAWRAAIASFFAHVYPKLKAAGIEIFVNAGGFIDGNPLSNGGYTDKALWSLIVNNVDGLNTEYFMQAANNNDAVYYDAPTISSWMGNWKSWLDLIDIAQNAGKAFYGMSVANNEQVKRYLRASFLMKWNGVKGANIIAQGWYGVDRNPGISASSPGWMNDPGLPHGAMAQAGVGYKRVFDKLTVLINPSPATVATIDGHAIAPKDALFV